MNFLDRSKNKLYKTYIDCSVEYHAGGFFIRKTALYVYIQSVDSLFILQKNEGLHPLDNEYSRLLSEELRTSKFFRLVDLSNNIATFNGDTGRIKIMPSVFAENFNNQQVSELLIEFEGGNIQILFLVYDTSPTSA